MTDLETANILLDGLMTKYVELEAALEQSIKLQSHYALLLNQHDGGERRVFLNAREWLDRLKETGTEKRYEARCA
jgi:predicted lipase